MTFRGGQRRSFRTAAAWIAVGVLLSPSTVLAGPNAARTERVSIATDGTQGDLFTFDVSMSDDGQVVAWDSYATTFVPDDTNEVEDVFVRLRATGETQRVSVAPDGSQSDWGSGWPSVSGDGRFVAFSSEATNLVPGDTNRRRDIFVRDLTAGVTERVSVASDGSEANNISLMNAISADGRYVAFMSDATNLSPNDVNISPDIFVHDRATGETELVSVASDGNPADDGSLYLDISADGRFVAFSSYASNLAPGDTNTQQDVFVHDRETGETKIASLTLDGGFSPNDATNPSVSDDGRFVAFQSPAGSFVPADGNGVYDIFVHDFHTGRTKRVSVDGAGIEAADGGRPFSPGSFFPSISGDGRFISFQSDSTSLIPDDNDFDVFVHDLVTGATTVPITTLDGEIPNKGAGRPELSGDGRYVVYGSDSTNLVEGDTNNWYDTFVTDIGPPAGLGHLDVGGTTKQLTVTGWARFAGSQVGAAQDAWDDGGPGALQAGAELTDVSIAHRPEEDSLFIRWEVASLPPVTAGLPGVTHALFMRAGDTDYEIRASRMGPGAAAASGPEFTLFSCTTLCEEVSSLKGSFGSTGTEVTALVPLDVLGSPQTLSDVRAASGAGSSLIGIVHELDSLHLGDITIPIAEIAFAVTRQNVTSTSYDHRLRLEGSAFSTHVNPEQELHGPHVFWARTCFGDACETISLPLQCEGGPPSRERPCTTSG